MKCKANGVASAAYLGIDKLASTEERSNSLTRHINQRFIKKGAGKPAPLPAKDFA